MPRLVGRTGLVFVALAALGLSLLVAHYITRSDSPASKATAVATPGRMASPIGDPAADAVVVAAGDIACGAGSSSAKCQQQATSGLVLAQQPDAVLVLGDNQYECGQLDDYATYFDPTWGRFKGLIRPAAGNHEYRTGAKAECGDTSSGAPGYWSYFGDAASPLDPGCRKDCRGYYSYDVGAWHIIALNSECSRVDGCEKGSPQEEWLRSDLAAHPARCTLAYFHHPRWSSGNHGSISRSSAFWEDLYAAGAEVVLNGHDHDYERFAPQTPAGKADPGRGVREFVVGTGGRNHTGLSDRTGRIDNSEVFDGETFGVLKLTLRLDGYDWQFVPVAGAGFTDSGSGRCH